MYVVLICATCFEEGRDTRITVPYDSDTQQIQYPVGWYRDRCPQCNAKRMLENAYRPHTPYTGDTNDND